MNTKELRDHLRLLKTPDTNGYFAMKQYGGGPDESYIEANRNGIISFAEILLESIDESNTGNEYAIPVEFYDDGSDIVLEHIYLKERTAEARANDRPEPASTLTQLGCAAALLAMVVVFIVGFVSSVAWLAELF